MALTTITGGLFIPPYLLSDQPPNINNTTADSLSGTTRQRLALVMEVPKTGTLDKVEVYCGFISAPSDVKFSFQTVASGLPDGTPDQYRVVVAASVVVGWLIPGLMTSDGTDGGSKRSVTRGEIISCVMEWNTTQTGQMWLYGVDNFNVDYTTVYPYSANHNGTSWSKFLKNHYPTMVLKYDDGTYELPVGMVYPIQALNTRSYGTGSSPDERGLYFSFPVDVTVDGAWIWMDLNAAADVVLYDTDGTTPLQTKSLSSSDQQSATIHLRIVQFDTPQDLSAGQFYRLAFKPTTATTCSTYEYTVNSAAIMAANPGGGDFHLTTRVDAGAWTQTTTQRPWMGLHISKIESGAGGGGGQRSYVG